MWVEQQEKIEKNSIDTSWDKKKLLQASKKTANTILWETRDRISKNANPNNRWVEDYSDKWDFNKAYSFAKKTGEKEFIWNGERYSTKQKFDEKDIINYQKNKFNYENRYSRFIRNRLANNTLPNNAISIGKVFQEFWNIIENKKERWNKNTRAVAFYKNYLWEVEEQDKKWLMESKYKPTDYDPKKHKDKRYFSPLAWMNAKDINYYLNNCIKYQIIRKENRNAKITDSEEPLVERNWKLPYNYESREHAWDLIPNLEQILERDKIYEKKFDELVQKWYSWQEANKLLYKEMNYDYWDYDEIDVLWWHNIRFREDLKWKFMEIRDTFDLSKYDTITKWKPFEVYDRIYYKNYDGEIKQMFLSDNELKELDINKRKFDTLELQRELSNRWYELKNSKKEDGNFDGVLGDETKNALLDRQKKH